MKFTNIYLILLLVFISCKNNGNNCLELDNVECKQLIYYLDKGIDELESFKGIEREVSKDIYIRSFAFYKKGSDNYSLIIELQDDVTEEIVSKYIFAVEGFVDGNELINLSTYSKSKGREFDAWYGLGSLEKVSGHCYIIIDVKTRIKKFKLMKFYLFDKKGYKGDIGQRILIHNFEIN